MSQVVFLNVVTRLRAFDEFFELYFRETEYVVEQFTFWVFEAAPLECFGVNGHVT
jgi:hypothetical protein